MRMWGPLFAQGLAHRAVDSFDKETANCFLVIDVSHFARIRVQTVGVLYGSDVSRLR